MHITSYLHQIVHSILGFYCPAQVKKYIDAIDDTYFSAYDRFYDIVKDTDGGSAYTAFYIYGKGKTAKVQCDFSAMISPAHFKEFVKPNLEKQCDMLDYSILGLAPFAYL